METFDLSTRAMLVSLNVSQWTAKKRDKKASDEIAEKHSASKDAGRYDKCLVARDCLAEITRIVSQMRTTHYALTLPWGENGLRILSSQGFVHYTEKMRGLRYQFNVAADKFAAEYPKYVAQSELLLGSLRDETDYPAPEDIRSRFDVKINFYPVPESGDFRVEMEHESADIIRKALQDESQALLKNATQDVIQRLHETASKLVNTLTNGDGEKSPRFHDTLVTNIQDLLETVPMLNLTNDPEITKWCDQMHESIGGVEAWELRESSPLRAAVAKNVGTIVQKMEAFL